MPNNEKIIIFSILIHVQKDLKVRRHETEEYSDEDTGQFHYRGEINASDKVLRAGYYMEVSFFSLEQRSLRFLSSFQVKDPIKFGILLL